LALKNTPLAFLTAHSYERLNVLHQAAGYCTVVDVILHALLQIVSEEQCSNLALFLEREQIMGIVAGLALVTTFTSAVFLKPIRYEAFYIVHIVMFMLILISIGMHRPNLSDKSIFIIIVAASIWGSDRLLRASRLMIMAFGNRATIAPLGQGGVRISMHRPLWRATPGSHVFLWIPRIRPFEAHPFTVVSTNPLELVISAQDGFTRDLLSYATANPGATLRASYDGPYGTLPNFSKFDQVVLIAGGSGASFTFGVALHLVRQAPTSGRYSKINFMWVIREHGKLVSFAPNRAFLTNNI
jgi:predicted ferric reductase